MSDVTNITIPQPALDFYVFCNACDRFTPSTICFRHRLTNEYVCIYCQFKYTLIHQLDQ